MEIFIIISLNNSTDIPNFVSIYQILFGCWWAQIIKLNGNSAKIESLNRWVRNGSVMSLKQSVESRPTLARVQGIFFCKTGKFYRAHRSFWFFLVIPNTPFVAAIA